MKKIIIVVLVIGVLYYLFSDGGGGGGRNIKVMGYKGNVTNVENGNTLVLSSGLKVQMLGVKQNHERAELWIKNNVVGKSVELVSDSKNEQTFNSIGAKVKAYVIVEHNGKKSCANRLVVEDNRDCATLEFVNDSTFIPKKKKALIINDKALYMKQRTMLVETSSGIGTAFFINKLGIALTNNHVLDGSNPAHVYLYAEDAEDSKIYSSRRRNIRNILWTNKDLDITVFSVELENGEEAAFFNLIDRHESVGNNCHILGNPIGLMASFGSGQISAYRDDSEVKGRKLVQYNLSTNGGNSGGPVMNDKGEIIAVHAMGIKSAQGLNFGIDILQVREVLDSPGVDVNYGGK